jgi:hypothetical protein
MTVLLLLALIVFAAAAIGAAIQRSFWLALVALGLALATFAALSPHIGLH